MNKYDILECMYKTIKNSLEWGFGEDNYACFVDGIVTMTEATLEKLKESEDVQAERLKELDSAILKAAKTYTDECVEATGYAATLSEDLVPTHNATTCCYNAECYTNLGSKA